MKNLLFKTMMCAGATTLLLAGCQSEDLYNPNAVTEKYEQAWKEAFGEIDSDQTWNLAKQVTANVDLSDLSGSYELRIYTSNPVGGNAKLLAKTEIRNAGNISFDVPSSLSYVFVAADGNEGRIINGYYALNGNEINVGSKTSTRATETCNTTVGKTIVSEGSSWIDGYTPENPRGDWDHQYSYNKTYYVLENVKTETVETGWKASDFAKITGSDGVFAESKKNWKLHSELPESVSYKMNSTGPITMTYSFGATADDDIFGYYYYKDGESRKDAKLYVLMESAKPSNYITQNGVAVTDMGLANIDYISGDDMIKGTEFTLAYFDEEGNASYDFPAGINVEFFLINKTKAQSETYYHANSYFSTKAAQDELGHPSTTLEHVAAVTYNYGKTTFLGFEDEMGYGDEDMNDILFFVTGDFDKPEDIDPDKSDDEAYSWILACEDLGNTGDFDFNDVVFSVSHVSGSDKATVTPLAAGGILAAEIYFGETSLGEIHEMLNADVTSMVNTTTITNSGTSTPVTVGSDFSMAENMGGFKVKVGDNNSTSTIIEAPGTSEIPQMICVSSDWEWPTEKTRIDVAYTDFSKWVKDSSFTTWTDNKASDKVVSRSSK